MVYIKSMDDCMSSWDNFCEKKKGFPNLIEEWKFLTNVKQRDIKDEIVVDC